MREQKGKKEGAGGAPWDTGDDTEALLSTGFPQMGQAGLDIPDRYIMRS